MTQKDYFEIFKTLPPKVQDAITSVNSANVMKRIGEKYSLHIDKVGELADEISNVMFGLTDRGNLPLNLQKKLGLPKEKIEEIIQIVDNEIFHSIQESLKQIQPKEETAAAPEKMPGEEISPIASETEQKEGTAPLNLPTGDISSLKLGGMFKVPQEQGESSTATDEKPERQEISKEQGVDPYREPVE